MILRRTATLITTLALAFILITAGLLQMASNVSAADLTTKYRIYQNEKIQMEFANYNTALAYAKKLRNSHIEEIGTRRWIWDNYPRYRLYQYSNSKPNWEFATLQAAITEAKKYDHMSIRDLQSSGWVWNNYPKYIVYQGDITLARWQFLTQNEAIVEAKKWANSHIIDLKNNKWIWDNITAAKKKEYRSGLPKYTVYQGTITKDTWNFAYLEDAIIEALKWKNSHVVRTSTNNLVYSNIAQYKIYQRSLLLDRFVDLDAAILYANKWNHALIKIDESEIWNNWPYYQVFQNKTRIGEHTTLKEALKQGFKFENASVATYHGQKIWDNDRDLLFLGWNGSYKPESIKSHVSQTLGLDIDSPTWFELKDASGNIEDSSDPGLAAWLKQQNIAIHPLVHNQFNAALTTLFLSNPEAQKKFIAQLIQRAAELGVAGLNIDFESISSKDRDAYTAFIAALTTAAHQRSLIISIDLPRGSIKWNHLTAYDHVKLAGIVDYIITMTYDQHYSGSLSAGSVAGLQWTETGIQEFLSYGIPRDKLLLGIPFYMREWKIDSNGLLVSNRAIFMKDITAFMAEKKAISTWDTTSQQYRVEYMEDGFKYVFWLEDEKSVKLRLDLAKKYDLAGVAAWRLGYDQAELWKMMIKEK